MSRTPRELAGLFVAEFRDGGRGEADPATGVPCFDCWGLVMAAHAAYGVELPDFRASCFDPQTVSGHVASEQASGRWERLDAPEAPCLVAMRNHPEEPRAVNHFGAYIGGGEFLHIMETKPAGKDSIHERPWRGRIAGFWRWTGR